MLRLFGSRPASFDNNDVVNRSDRMNSRKITDVCCEVGQEVPFRQGAGTEKRLEFTMIPDTLEGALILSAIDFFLSFIIIGGIGLVLAAFPYLNRLGSISDEHLKGGH